MASQIALRMPLSMHSALPLQRPNHLHPRRMRAALELERIHDNERRPSPTMRTSIDNMFASLCRRIMSRSLTKFYDKFSLLTLLRSRRLEACGPRCRRSLSARPGI